jgi:hypothetical protein
MKETALERLSNINNILDLQKRINAMRMGEFISDIQEVVALAKANQQPSIDMLRFEAAKAAMQGILAGIVRDDKFSISDILENSVYYGDALIAELQKTKP